MSTVAATTQRARNRQPLDVIQQPHALLRMETMAALAGKSVATLYRDVAAGRLKLVKDGSRCTRIRAEDARAYLEAQGSATSRRLATVGEVEAPLKQMIAGGPRSLGAGSRP